MVAEHIKVDFGYRYTDVHCTFTFRNTETQGVVEQLVGFPDIGAAEEIVERRDPEHADAIGEATSVSPLKNLKTWVNGRRVRSELKYADVRWGKPVPGDTVVWMWDRKKGGVRAWHTVRVAFPPAQDVTIERRYRVENGSSAAGVAFFNYTTATGGVWKGTIGRLQADITLEDGATAGSLIWPGQKVRDDVIPPQLATSPKRAEWQVLDRTHMRLVWEDFEPRTEPRRRGFALSRSFHGW
jgi:hypothetical protein